MLRATLRRWAKAGGWRTLVYENSLLGVMTLLFAGTWFRAIGHGVARLQRGAAGARRGEGLVGHTYLTEPDFWERTLQNWQSEFLAVGTMAVFTVYLRQRGSPESKPVGSPHSETGTSG